MTMVPATEPSDLPHPLWSMTVSSRSVKDPTDYPRLLTQIESLPPELREEILYYVPRSLCFQLAQSHNRLYEAGMDRFYNHIAPAIPSGVAKLAAMLSEEDAPESGSEVQKKALSSLKSRLAKTRTLTIARPEAEDKMGRPRVTDDEGWEQVIADFTKLSRYLTNLRRVNMKHDDLTGHLDLSSFLPNSVKEVSIRLTNRLLERRNPEHETKKVERVTWIFGPTLTDYYGSGHIGRSIHRNGLVQGDQFEVWYPQRWSVLSGAATSESSRSLIEWRDALNIFSYLVGASSAESTIVFCPTRMEFDRYEARGGMLVPVFPQTLSAFDFKDAIIKRATEQFPEFDPSRISFGTSKEALEKFGEDDLPWESEGARDLHVKYEGDHHDHHSYQDRTFVMSGDWIMQVQS